MQTTTAKPMGSLLPGIVDQSIAGTVSSGPLTRPSQVLDLASLPKRLDDPTLALLREMVTSPLPQDERCDEGHFAECLRMLTILPRRAEDELTGRLRHNLYLRKLGGYSDGAISYLASTALEQCHWFPSIAECLKILAAWPNRDVAAQRRGKAEVLVRGEMQARMNEALAALERRELDQPAIDALPDLWKRVAAERCLLWSWPDGRFTVRADMERLSETEQQSEREAIAAMMAEWERIEAAQLTEPDQPSA